MRSHTARRLLRVDVTFGFAGMSVPSPQVATELATCRIPTFSVDHHPGCADPEFCPTCSGEGAFAAGSVR
jgi:hypothetical protein